MNAQEIDETLKTLTSVVGKETNDRRLTCIRKKVFYIDPWSEKVDNGNQLYLRNTE